MEVSLSVKIQIRSAGPERVIQVEGRLDATCLAVLREAIDGKTERAWLDLSQLRSADVVGVEMLRETREEGARFTGTSPYLTMLLDGPGSDRSSGVAEQSEEKRKE